MQRLGGCVWQLSQLLKFSMRCASVHTHGGEHLGVGVIMSTPLCTPMTVTRRNTVLSGSAMGVWLCTKYPRFAVACCGICPCMLQGMQANNVVLRMQLVGWDPPQLCWQQ